VTVKRSVPIVFVGSSNPVEDGYVAATFEAAAETLNIEPNNAFVHRTSDLEAVMSNLGQRPDGGLVVAPDTFTTANRVQVVMLTARYRLPAIYGLRQFPESSGLLSYGPDTVDTIRRAATYVDRNLAGLL
jgi:putative ABC transport system substrate-binding protein